jgi:hypothetical protein
MAPFSQEETGNIIKALVKTAKNPNHPKINFIKNKGKEKKHAQR